MIPRATLQRLATPAKRLALGDADRAHLLANIHRKLPPAMTVAVRLTEELERTPLGKTPFVLRRTGVPGPATGGTP